MIYALVLLLCFADGWPALPASATSCDFPPLPTIETGVVFPIPEPVAQEDDGQNREGCSAGKCRTGAAAHADDNACASGDCTAPVRPFRPLRNLFRGRR